MHISKFLQLRKQMHLFCSVEKFMGACMGLCTPGILCQSGSQSEQTHTHSQHGANCRSLPGLPNPPQSSPQLDSYSLDQSLLVSLMPSVCLSVSLSECCWQPLFFFVFITLSLCNRTTLNFINTPMTCLKKGNPEPQNEYFFSLASLHCPCCIFSILVLAFKYSCKWMEEVRGGWGEGEGRWERREREGGQAGAEAARSGGGYPFLELPAEDGGHTGMVEGGDQQEASWFI